MRVKMENGMNDMTEALLRAGVIDEEYLEETAKKVRMDKFWEDPSMYNLLELDALPQEAKAKVGLVVMNDPRWELIQISRLDFNKRIDAIGDLDDRNLLQSHHRILWMDSSGNVHDVDMQEEDTGKTLTEIVDSDATCVLSMYYSTDPRRPVLLGFLTDIHSVELFLT